MVVEVAEANFYTTQVRPHLAEDHLPYSIRDPRTFTEKVRLDPPCLCKNVSHHLLKRYLDP